jgi:hypothetical protein
MQTTPGKGMDFGKDFVLGTVRICKCGIEYAVKSRNQKQCTACAHKNRILTSRLHLQNKKAKNDS